MRKELDSIYFEAVSDWYIRENFPPDFHNSLEEIGWMTPAPDNEECRNFYVEFYGDTVDHKNIGEFLAKTFRHGFVCSLRDKYTVRPAALLKKVKFVTLRNQDPQRDLEDGESNER